MVAACSTIDACGIRMLGIGERFLFARSESWDNTEPHNIDDDAHNVLEMAPPAYALASAIRAGTRDTCGRADTDYASTRT